jgi:hypothetical protein
MAAYNIKDVSTPAMPDYMQRGFDNAIKRTGKNIDSLIKADCEFYIANNIWLQITGQERYNSNVVIAFKGLRIRMSTMQQPYQCHLRGNGHSIRFSVTSSRKSFEAKSNPIMSLVDLYNRITFHWAEVVSLWVITLFGWFMPFSPWRYLLQLCVLIIVVANVIYRLRHERTAKPKHKPKHSTEQMTTLSELFEGYDERPQTPSPPPRYPPTQDTAYR